MATEEMNHDEESEPLHCGDQVATTAACGGKVVGTVIEVGYSPTKKAWMAMVQCEISDCNDIKPGTNFVIQAEALQIIRERMTHTGAIDTDWLGNEADLKL